MKSGCFDSKKWLQELRGTERRIENSVFSSNLSVVTYAVITYFAISDVCFQKSQCKQIRTFRDTVKSPDGFTVVS